MANFRSTSLKILSITTIIVAIFTVLSAWVGWFNPLHWWFLSITGLGFPILFVLNFVFLLFWMVVRKKNAIIPLLVLLIVIVKLPMLFQWNNPNAKPEYTEGQSDKFRVMSFNVRVFDLYNWIYNYSTREEIFDFLTFQQPDIVCFQEFYSSERDNMNNVDLLPGLLNAKYNHIEYPITKYTTDHYGIATFSKYPIINKGMIYLDKNTTNICIYTDILFKSDTLRVYNCHLQSVRFGADEYKFIEDMGSDNKTIKRTKTIIGRLKRAFIKRSLQAELIAKHVQESPYPVIMCGDFNDTALSYSYKILTKHLKDSFRESGRGLGSTYAGPIPGLRIDYILHSPEIISFGYKTHQVKLSDHYPIESGFVIQR